MQLSIRVGIDGITDLVVHGSELHWHHIKYVVPNAAIINGATWQPSWPAQSTSCDCDSSSTEVTPPLPSRSQVVVVTPLTARTPIVVDQPTAANDYTLVLHFNDDPSGSAYYEFTIGYVSP